MLEGVRWPKCQFCGQNIILFKLIEVPDLDFYGKKLVGGGKLSHGYCIQQAIAKKNELLEE